MLYEIFIANFVVFKNDSIVYFAGWIPQVTGSNLETYYICIRYNLQRSIFTLFTHSKNYKLLYKFVVLVWVCILQTQFDTHPRVRLSLILDYDFSFDYNKITYYQYCCSYKTAASIKWRITVFCIIHLMCNSSNVKRLDL